MYSLGLGAGLPEAVRVGLVPDLPRVHAPRCVAIDRGAREACEGRDARGPAALGVASRRARPGGRVREHGQHLQAPCVRCRDDAVEARPVVARRRGALHVGPGEVGAHPVGADGLRVESAASSAGCRMKVSSSPYAMPVWSPALRFVFAPADMPERRPPSIAAPKTAPTIRSAPRNATERRRYQRSLPPPPRQRQPGAGSPGEGSAGSGSACRVIGGGSVAGEGDGADYGYRRCEWRKVRAWHLLEYGSRRARGLRLGLDGARHPLSRPPGAGERQAEQRREEDDAPAAARRGHRTSRRRRRRTPYGSRCATRSAS